MLRIKVDSEKKFQLTPTKMSLGRSTYVNKSLMYAHIQTEATFDRIFS